MMAALATALGIDAKKSAIALAIVFLLNGIDMYVFPPVGHFMHLTPIQFGFWSALGIHDTSSVVGAARLFHQDAILVATTVKLARAVMILVFTPLLARMHTRRFPQEHWEGKKPKYPLFIFGYLLVAALVTFVPPLRPAGKVVAEFATQSLSMVLFLIGSAMSLAEMKKIGWRPVIMAVVLWLIMSVYSLFAVLKTLFGPLPVVTPLSSYSVPAKTRYLPVAA